MKAQVRSMARAARALLRPDHVQVDGSVLPARELRYCGPRFADDRTFLASAEAEADRLESRLQLAPASRILDLGCGVGRLAIGLLRRKSELAEYRGVDVSRRSIRWCERHVEPLDRRFRFAHVDVRNARYNPRGRSTAAERRLPFEAGRFDIIYLYSVFSHLTSPDVHAYLGEFQRLLAPGGRVFLTAFIEDGVEDEAVNPPGYGLAWEGPLHGVRFARRFFEGMLSATGFGLDALEHGRETDGQSGLYVSRR